MNNTKEKDELQDNCNSVEELTEYLMRKAQNHNNYKYYSPLKRIVDNCKSNSLYLTTGEKWNDITDRTNFNSNLNGATNFGQCFSFSRDESVAMWMLYGGIDKLGGMIDFTKKGMQSILRTDKVELGYFEEQTQNFKCLKTIDKSKFKIFLIDIVYYKKNGKYYYISRYDEKFATLSEQVFAKLNFCKKVNAWKYENECRLIVSVNTEELLNKCNVARIDLSNLDLGKSLERLYHAPNYPKQKNTYGSKESELGESLDWSICENCKKPSDS